MIKTSRDREDEVFEMLSDARERYLERADKSLRELRAAREEWIDAVIRAEDWAVRERLMPSQEEDDEAGRPHEDLLDDLGSFEVHVTNPGDLPTQFKERVSDLRHKEKMKSALKRVH